MVGTRHIVGLAIDDSGVVATELCIRAGRTEVRDAGEFPWEGEFTVENAREQGQRLHKLLREKGFTAKRAVIGLAAKWVLAKEVEAPPATPEALAGILSIQAERVFSMNASELVFDYCGRTSTSEKSQVLLLATRRQVIDQMKALAEGAGLQIVSITVSAFACGHNPSMNGSACRYGLYTRPTYCEFWGQSDGSPRFIKHIPMVLNGNPSGYTDLLGSTIQRQILLSSRQNQTPPHQVAAYDACGLGADAFDRLNKRLAPQIKICGGQTGVLPAPADGSTEGRSVAAAAVAWTAVAPEGPTVDFLNSRIGVQRKTGDQRVIVWATAVAVLSLLVMGVWLVRWQSDRNAIAGYRQELDAMGGDLATTKEVVDRLSYAGRWGDTDPRFLRCLRELTLAFPEEGTVWVTSLVLDDSREGSITGKASSEAGLHVSVVGNASDETSFHDVLDKINANEAFADVEMMYLQGSNRNSREKEFAIKFTFKGVK